MVQHLSDVYANVRDFLATGNGVDVDTIAIQAAIDSGMHVLFPAGTYLFDGTLEFNRFQQRCTFLAGAILVPADSFAYVRIGYPVTVPTVVANGSIIADPALTGAEQTIVGLRVEAPEGVTTRSPLVEIYGATKLLMQEMRVSVNTMDEPRYSDGTEALGPRAAVRVMDLTRCTFIGGSISGGSEPETVGLWLANSYDYNIGTGDINPNPGQWWPDVPDKPDQDGTPALTLALTGSGAYETGAVGLTIEAFGWAVRISCVCDNPTFVNCTFADNVDGALLVTDDGDVLASATYPVLGDDDVWTDEAVVVQSAIAKVLMLVGCHMGGESPDQYVQVEGLGMISGGVVIGCTFGPDATDPDTTEPSIPGGGGPVGFRMPDPADPVPTGRHDPLPPLPSSTGGGIIVAGQGATRGAGSGKLTSSSSVGDQTKSKTSLSKGQTRGQSALAKAAQSQSVGSRGLGMAAAVPPSGPGSSDVDLDDANDSTDPCIFRISGTVLGMSVSGCHSEAVERRTDVWNISEPARVSIACDMFNSWGEPNVAVGQRAGYLARMTSTATGELTLTAKSVSLTATNIGFFDAAPVVRGSAYTTYGRFGSGDRTLTTTNVDQVLSQLLIDLSNLGLVKRR